MDYPHSCSSSKLLLQLFLLLCLRCTNCMRVYIYIYMPSRNNIDTSTDAPRQCGGSLKGVHPRAERGCSLAIDARHPAVTMATAASLAARSPNSHILRKTSTTWPEDKKDTQCTEVRLRHMLQQTQLCRKHPYSWYNRTFDGHQHQLLPLNKTHSFFYQPHEPTILIILPSPLHEP